MMVPGTLERRLLQRLAKLLEYPQPGLIEAARECEALASSGDGGAAALLQAFRAFAETTPPGRLEEVYSSTFDLDPACHPYVGYHLLGESYARSAFLLQLKARYRAQQFDGPRNELPDHLAVMLGFLAVNEDTSLAEELIGEALLPALDRMTGRAKSEGYQEEGTLGPQEGRKPDHPYRGVLEALRLVLQRLASDGRMAGDQRSAVV